MTRHDFIDRDHQGSAKRVLVVVFLRGGADAMTLVPPTGDDEYYKSRSLKSRLGAWASRQSQPLSSRAELMAEVAKITAAKGVNPERPPFWGGYRVTPTEIEFWADGAFRLHDRFVWRRSSPEESWSIARLNP